MPVMQLSKMKEVFGRVTIIYRKHIPKTVKYNGRIYYITGKPLKVRKNECNSVIVISKENKMFAYIRKAITI